MTIPKFLLKGAVTQAYNDMPPDSISPEEAQKQKDYILKKIESEEITTIEGVLEEFDSLNKGA